MSSRSKTSRNRQWLVLVLLLLGVFVRSAAADKRRVVVLSFDGDEKVVKKFHVAVVKLIRKSHTVVSTKKWESTAEEMSATSVNSKNIKKLAKKLRVDGVIEGSVKKRRDNYIIKLKLYSGATGEVTRKVDTKAEGTRLDGDASRDIKDELVDAIGELKSVKDSGGGDDDDDPIAKKKDDDKKVAKKDKDDDDEDKPKKSKKSKKDKDDDEDKPKKSKFSKKDKDDDEDKPKKSKFSSGKMDKDDDEDPIAKKKDDDKKVAKKDKDDDEDKPKKSKKRPKKSDDDDDDDGSKKKKVASKDKDDDDDDGVTERGESGAKLSGDEALAPANRAIDATFGISLNARRLAWKSDPDLVSSMGTAGVGRPPNYNGLPAPGAVLDIEAYPLAFGHKKTKSYLKDIGITAMYDRALLIKSKLNDGTELKTASERYLFGAAFRYPLGSLVVGGRLGYGRQLFEIAGADLPNVGYTMIEPGAFLKFPIAKLTFGLDLSYQLMLKEGQISDTTQYGKASVSGLDVDLSGDYPLTKNIFARGSIKVERIAYKFNGTGMLSTGRDSDPEQDVQGATDMYLGAAITLGILY